MRSVIRGSLGLLMALAMLASLGVSALAYDYPFYPDDPTSYTPETVYADRDTPDGKVMLYPGESFVFTQDESFDEKGLKYVGLSTAVMLDDGLDAVKTVYTPYQPYDDNTATRYIYTNITLSESVDYALVVEVYGAGPARMYEPDENTRDVQARYVRTSRVPLYIPLSYDYSGGEVFGGGNPEKVLNPKQPTYLAFTDRPYKEGNRLYTIGWTSNYCLEPDESYPAGAYLIRTVLSENDLSQYADLPAFWVADGTMTYHLNGGTYKGISDHFIEEFSFPSGKGTLSIASIVPEKEGAVFAGWYSDEALTQKVESPDDVSIYNGFVNKVYAYHLYAKWEEEPDLDADGDEIITVADAVAHLKNNDAYLAARTLQTVVS